MIHCKGMSASPATIGDTTGLTSQRFKEADMELKPIRSKKDYQSELSEIERLRDAPAKSAAAEVLIKPYRLHLEAGELEAA